MTQERRPESDTPSAEPRTFQDDEGRQWSGFVMSGRFEGGEEHAEVVFVCEDAPSEAKRSTRMSSPPARAAEEWQGMEEAQVRKLFQDSRPA